MMAVAENRGFRLRLGLPVSVGVHAALIALLLAFLTTIDTPVAPPEESVTVEIVPPPNARPAPPPEPASPKPAPAESRPVPQASDSASLPEQAPKPAEPLPVAPSVPVPQGEVFTTARQLYSDRVLANPRSKGAREALRQLSGEERIVQLCNLEALEQINRARPGSSPDFVAPYAMAAEEMTSDGVEVKGGAFRAKKKWYNIQFKCTVDVHSGKVASFAFALGEAIPESEWQAHDLVADDGPAD
jgi:hypothetical protein